MTNFAKWILNFRNNLFYNLNVSTKSYTCGQKDATSNLDIFQSIQLTNLRTKI